MIDQLFQSLDFSSNEIKTYLQLAEVGRSTAHLIAKRIKIPRTTIYSVLASLVEKGLVSEEQRKGATYFIPNKPESIVRLINKKQEHLKNKEIIAKELSLLVAPFFKSKNFSIPKIQFFEGKDNIESMLFDNILAWQSSMQKYDSTWWGYQDVSFVKNFKKFLEHSWKIKRDQEQIQLISNADPIEKKLKDKVKGRSIKEMPKEYEFASTIWVVGDYIVLIMTKEEPYYAFQMKDEVFSANLRLIFQMLWKFLP